MGIGRAGPEDSDDPRGERVGTRDSEGATSAVRGRGSRDTDPDVIWLPWTVTSAQTVGTPRT